MITTNLYEHALISPNKNGANELFAVSGYASATFANKHLSESEDAVINLIIGMPGKRSDHLGFLRLYDKFQGRFNGYYLKGSPPVHAKAYGWYKKDNPYVGFSGSANYSQPGFFEKTQINQLNNEDPALIKDFYDLLIPRCEQINEFEFDPEESAVYSISPQLKTSVEPGSIEWEIPNKRVRISFLDRRGNLPQVSGLNWGQRDNREPNQAYLSLKTEARKEGFLPSLAETFTLITDDNFSMDCAVAQQGRKAIHSTFNNSEIGRYIRKRIGLKEGALVSTQDLINYGRTDYTIEKLDEETFLLDLSI